MTEAVEYRDCSLSVDELLVWMGNMNIKEEQIAPKSNKSKGSF